MKLGIDEVLMVSNKCYCFRSDPLWEDPGRGQEVKMGYKGAPYLTIFFRPESFSNKPNK